MGALYIDTGGAATNSGSRDANSAALTGTAATVSASVVTLDGSPDLSGVTTSGANQDTIYLNDATNANRKIFWITAVDNVMKTVTVDVAPTGVVSSAWAIGGRYAAPAGNGLNLIDGALRAGDIVTLNNSPATATVDWLTARADGTSAAGFIKLKGATGSRPVITISNTTQVFEGVDKDLWWLENIEAVQQGASGNVLTLIGAGTVIYNVKVSDGGGIGMNPDEANVRIIGNEITGVGGDGINTNISVSINGNYIHDLTGDGYENTATNPQHILILNNIFDTCGGRGILDSGAASTTLQLINILGNTIYGCGNTGIEITDADRQVTLMNNICSENGNAAGEYNVEWVAGTAEANSFHAWNVFYHSGGGGGANLSGLTVNAQVASSEFTTDPAFTNAAGGDFSIGSTSPAKAAGFPGQFLGGSLGYLDIGAVQRQEPSGGSGSQRVIGG